MTTSPKEANAMPAWNTGMQEFYWYFGTLEEKLDSEQEIPCDMSCADDEAELIVNSCLRDKSVLQHFLKEPFRHVARWMNYPPRWEQKVNHFLQALVECVRQRLVDEGVPVNA